MVIPLEMLRTWAFETGVCNGEILPKELPYNGYYEYYAPTYELDVRSANMTNANSKNIWIKY